MRPRPCPQDPSWPASSTGSTWAGGRQAPGSSAHRWGPHLTTGLTSRHSKVSAQSRLQTSTSRTPCNSQSMFFGLHVFLNFFKFELGDTTVTEKTDPWPVSDTQEHCIPLRLQAARAGQRPPLWQGTQAPVCRRPHPSLLSPDSGVWVTWPICQVTFVITCAILSSLEQIRLSLSWIRSKEGGPQAPRGRCRTRGSRAARSCAIFASNPENGPRALSRLRTGLRVSRPPSWTPFQPKASALSTTNLPVPLTSLVSIQSQPDCQHLMVACLPPLTAPPAAWSHLPLRGEAVRSPSSPPRLPSSCPSTHVGIRPRGRALVLEREEGGERRPQWGGGSAEVPSAPGAPTVSSYGSPRGHPSSWRGRGETGGGELP